MNLSRTIVCLGLGLSIGCTAPPPSGSGARGKAAFTDAASITKRGDGNYDVVCQTGQTEVDSALQVQSGQICLGNNGMPQRLDPFNPDSTGQHILEYGDVAALLNGGSMRKIGRYSMFARSRSCPFPSHESCDEGGDCEPDTVGCDDWKDEAFSSIRFDGMKGSGVCGACIFPSSGDIVVRQIVSNVINLDFISDPNATGNQLNLSCHGYYGAVRFNGFPGVSSCDWSYVGDPYGPPTAVVIENLHAEDGYAYPIFPAYTDGGFVSSTKAWLVSNSIRALGGRTTDPLIQFALVGDFSQHTAP